MVFEMLVVLTHQKGEHCFLFLTKIYGNQHPHLDSQ